MTVDGGGTYALFFMLEEGFSEAVGSLGRVRFPRGVYVYAGSARSGLGPRLLRHARPVKRVHWHIDRLTSRPECQVVGAVTFGPDGPSECDIVRWLVGIPWVVMGPERFGASDHDCPGHLVVLGERPESVERAVKRLEEEGGSWLSFDGIERPGGP
ncbi:MAG: GIY-YIG nuclease family protein [Thermoplasmata archaeon]|nr:MAG: GIY-YIG nuclease family protein [Thermoplasmata archaeon]